MICAERITQHYGVRPILRDVSLEIQTGEVAAIIGPNGSGKSTILNVLGGILSPQSGHVEINGQRRRASIRSEREIRKSTVYLPDTVFTPGLVTGRDYILSIARLYKVPSNRAVEHAERLLKLFCLDGQADSLITSYSTGQKKKIGLCGALITDAKYFLLDEPFSGGLDPAGILAMKRVLQSFREDRSRTVIFTTPVAELVHELADRLILIRDGRIVGDYKVDELNHGGGTESVTRVVEELVFPSAVQNIQNYFAPQEQSA